MTHCSIGSSTFIRRSYCSSAGSYADARVAWFLCIRHNSFCSSLCGTSQLHGIRNRIHVRGTSKSGANLAPSASLRLRSIQQPNSKDIQDSDPAALWSQSPAGRIVVLLQYNVSLKQPKTYASNCWYVFRTLCTTYHCCRVPYLYQNKIVLAPSKHMYAFVLFIKKKWKASAASTTDCMVETQLCKLRDASDSFVGHACSIYHLQYVLFYKSQLSCPVRLFQERTKNGRKCALLQT